MAKTCPVRQWIEPAAYRFPLVPGVGISACWPRRIDIRPISGLVLTSTSILPESRLSRRQIRQELPQGGQFGLPLRVKGSHDRARTAVAQVAAMEPLADRLAADMEVEASGQGQNDQGASPSTAERAKMMRAQSHAHGE